MLKRPIDLSLSGTSPFSTQEHEPMEEERRDLEAKRTLFMTQPPTIRDWFETQAGQLVEALARSPRQVYFSLPEEVLTPSGLLRIPATERQQQVIGKNGALAAALSSRLSRLERSSHAAISNSAGCLRLAIAERLLAAHDPAWQLAFDDHGHLLVSSIQQARSLVASMQTSLHLYGLAGVLLTALAAGEGYQERQGRLSREMLHQASSLAAHEVQEIIEVIKRQAEANQLNRGLRLSLPYFDDRALKMKAYDFEVIPRGRILFEDYYVMWAARYEEERVQQDNRLSLAARRQLLSELKTLERAFEVPGVPPYWQPARKKRSFQTRIAALRLSLSTITMITTKKDKET